MQGEKCQKNLDAFYSLASEDSEILSGVFERETDECRDGLLLVFSTKTLLFEANEDDDTISVTCGSVTTSNHRSSFRPIRTAIWQPLVGKPFGWGWVTVNQQGYCDGALLSFDGITPSVLLGVIASSIEVSTVTSENDKERAAEPESAQHAPEGPVR
jgi:hypothetical protein